ncbi:T6SS phospholipase effector Tle1-like catalytic domain-containing protein [Gynuella sunshinyii]|uniref:T6SS Phospholipase effector Tle1-like catalytic domain-containing protein n=1 Tax=Gynuella sunshinyii YC6258 TaxID=1445510 RepID=A0A0C5VUE1_9GAMM|nr:DUF2235 domain-containing protein [Gynuella sunshinyii]AJQ96938.1 hypothetical protein YC6258_04906 [Gynuella sunshinyii YC6258]
MSTPSQDISVLPQAVKDYILSRGYSLNPLCWQATYQYPVDAKAFTPEQTRLHFFVLKSGGQLSLMTRHDLQKQGIVYELGPRQVHGATKPAQPRSNLDRPAPVWTADIADTLPTGKPGVDDVYNPEYFAQLQFLYPDLSTGVLTDYLITTPTQTFQNRLTGSSGKLSLYGPEQIHYEVGTAVTADQWQQAHDGLQQACEQLSEQRQNANALQDWPRTVQPLHLINTEVLHPGEANKMDAALFQNDGQPLTPLFNTAQEIWEQKCHRPDIFSRRFSQAQNTDKQALVTQLEQSLGVLGITLPNVGVCMADLVYLQAQEAWLQPLKAIAEQLGYSDPAAWSREAALTALICQSTKPRSEHHSGNQSPYFSSLQQIGRHLHQLAELQRQQDKVFTQTGPYNCLMQKTLSVPGIGANWAYQAAKNLSKPKRILRLGLFFDGTNQDRYNDEKLPDRDISNVAKMQDLYLEQSTQQGNEITTTRKVYIPGVGTITGHQTKDGFKAEDDKIGLGFGMGKTGGYARIERALIQINRHIEKAEYDEVVFDVFGFSRGAALSRHFVNLINEWPAQISIWELEAANPLWNLAFPIQPVKKQVKAFPQHLKGRVSFVGLWDTVGSFGWPGDEKNLDFNLNLNEHSAERIVHIVAEHEIRHNFPSTRLADVTDRLPSNAIELIAPGVHCDVGGGYENPTGKGFENWEIIPVKIHGGCNDGGILLRAKQREIEARGHYANAIDMDIIEEIRKATLKELAVYPLHQMIGEARQHGVPLKPISPDDVHYVIPQRLQKVYDMWQQAGGHMSTARQYLIEYIHTSERDGNPVDRPNMIKGHKKRQVFDNHPEQATAPENQYEHH